MPTYVHLVRHAQGYHNLSPANHDLPDPDLTPLGKEQCALLQRSFPYLSQITHLVASPLRRTLYTCLLAFASPPSQQMVVIAHPDLQEVAPLPCDTGSAPAALAAEFGGQAVDLSLLLADDDDWTDKTSAGSPYLPTVERLEARARRARAWLRGLGRRFEREHPGGGGADAHVVVVTHGGFLHFLTGDWDGMDRAKGTGWENCEWRSYEFVDAEGEGEGEARLRETRASWRRRRGSEKGLTETEQMELRVAMGRGLEEEWADVNGNGDGEGKEGKEE